MTTKRSNISGAFLHNVLYLFVSVRTDQNKNKRQNVIGNSLLFHDKADFSVGQYGLHHRAAQRDLLS